MRTLLSILLCTLVWAAAAPASPGSASGSAGDVLWLAQNTGDREQGREEPLPGELVLPQGHEPRQEERNCTQFCARWGKDCILINKGPGGMERRCRRVCKQFAEECF